MLRKLLLTIIFVKIHEKHQHVCFISLNFWTFGDLSIFVMLGLPFLKFKFENIFDYWPGGIKSSVNRLEKRNDRCSEVVR